MLKHLFLILGLIVAFKPSLADESLSFFNPPTASRPPPPDDGSCGNGGHGKDTRRTCDSFQWKLNRYLREEGDKNRGLRFYEAILEYESINKNNNNTYLMKITDIKKYFGDPDFERNSQHNNKMTKEYAYLFNYHSKKDWVCIVSFNNNDVESVSYGKTIGITFGGWTTYEPSKN